SLQPESAESSASNLFEKSDTAEAKHYEANRAKIAELRKQKYAEWDRAGEFWERDPGQWLRNPDYLTWARTAVQQPRFWLDNYLSTDYRIPINLVRTNSARAMATNALT